MNKHKSKKFLNKWNKIVILVVMTFLVIQSLSPAQMTSEQDNADDAKQFSMKLTVSFSVDDLEFGSFMGYDTVMFEDGILSGNPIDQGTVDSTLQLNVNVKANQEGFLNYWFTVGKSYKKIVELNKFVLSKNKVSDAIEESAGRLSQTQVNEFKKILEKGFKKGNSISDMVKEVDNPQIRINRETSNFDLLIQSDIQT